MNDKFKDKFKEEASELIAELEQLVLRLDQNRSDSQIIEEVFRVMHSLKGGSAMFGFDLIDKLTHLLENIYDKIRNNELKINDDILEVTLNVVDHLRNLLEETPANRNELEKTNNKFIKWIEDILSARPKQTDPVNQGEENLNDYRPISTYYIAFYPSLDFFADGSNPLFLIDDLWQLGELIMYTDYQHIPSLQEIVPTNCYIGWKILIASRKGINDLMDVFIFVNNRTRVEVHKISETNLLISEPQRKILLETLQKKDVNTLEQLTTLARDLEKIQEEVEEKNQRRTTQTVQTGEQAISSIRVSSEKLDNLINWVSELVTIQAQLSLYAQQNHYPGLTPIAEEIEKITRRLRDDVFSIRLIPVANMLTRFQRLVRELSHNLNKEVVFETKGTETELDKNIIEMLADPIMHIIRNSMDHGIEDTAEERIRKGKSPQGKITFNAFYSGTNVYIQIIDDGRGIDLKKVKKKAIEKGLISHEAELSHKELLDLVFLPGFSTATNVTNLSGRGVGMDVVKRKIADLRGQVEIESQENVGTTVTIKLPLTLSIIDGLLVKIDNTHIVIPLNSVYKVFEYKHEYINNAINNLILADGNHIPHIYLRKYFEFTTPPPPIERVVTIEFNDYYMGITVDEIVGEYQAVLKPLGKFYKNQEFFSGATILGDGTVALVLDPNKLIEEYAKNEVKIG